jgi:hypothetical protein
MQIVGLVHGVLKYGAYGVRLVASMAAASVAVACSSALPLPSSSSAPRSGSPPAVIVPLPVHLGGDCAGTGEYGFRLAGDVSADVPVWASKGERTLPVLWPSGYRARFDSELSILDERSRVIARGGDVFGEGGLNGHAICPESSVIIVTDAPAFASEPPGSAPAATRGTPGPTPAPHAVAFEEFRERVASMLATTEASLAQVAAFLRDRELRLIQLPADQIRFESDLTLRYVIETEPAARACFGSEFERLRDVMSSLSGVPKYLVAGEGADAEPQPDPTIEDGVRRLRRIQAELTALMGGLERAEDRCGF